VFVLLYLARFVGAFRGGVLFGFGGRQLYGAVRRRSPQRAAIGRMPDVGQAVVLFCVSSHTPALHKYLDKAL
jgi:hypothetical protein